MPMVLGDGVDICDVDSDGDDDIVDVLTRVKKLALTRLTPFTLWLATSSAIRRRSTTSGVRRQTPVNRPTKTHQLTRALQQSQVCFFLHRGSPGESCFCFF